MRTYYFKAYDAGGRKRTGTIPAADRHAADAELRKSNLRPYFIDDYRLVKQLLRQKQKKRQRLILVAGAVTLAASMVLGGLIVRYAGRERPIPLEDYQRTGVLAGATQVIVAESPEAREFGQEIFTMWNNFIPHAVTGIEVKPLLLTVYVSSEIRNLGESDLELLASNTIRAHQRRFGTAGCSLLVIENEFTLLEVNYNPVTRSTRIKSYR